MSKKKKNQEKSAVEIAGKVTKIVVAIAAAIGIKKGYDYLSDPNRHKA